MFQSPTTRPDRSPGRAAAIEIRRAVNDEIAVAAGRLDVKDGNQFAFLCECGDLSCKRWVMLTVAQYRALSVGSVVAHPVPA